MTSAFHMARRLGPLIRHSALATAASSAATPCANRVKMRPTAQRAA